MPRSLDASQQMEAREYHWLAEIVLGSIGTVRASSMPGHAWGGVVYDLPLDVGGVRYGLSRLASSPQPAADISLANVADVLGYACLAEAVMATDGLGITVTLWSMHGPDRDQMSTPLMHFTGTATPSYRDIDVDGSPSGFVDFACAGAGAIPLPRANVHGVTAPLPVGEAAVPPVWIEEKYYSITNRPSWGVNDAVVSPDVAGGDYIQLIGQASGQSPIGHTPGIPDTYVASAVSRTLFNDSNLSSTWSALLNRGWSFSGEPAVVTGVRFWRFANPWTGAATLADSSSSPTKFQASGITDPGSPQQMDIPVSPLSTIDAGSHGIILHVGGSPVSVRGIVAGAYPPAAIVVFGETRRRRLAVQFTLGSAMVVQKLRAHLGHASASVYYAIRIAEDVSGDPGAVIYDSGILSASGAMAWREVELSKTLDAGTYHFILVLNDNGAEVVSNYADVGVDNAAGDATHTTRLFNPATGTWDAQSFDLAFEIQPASTQVELKFNTVSQGVKAWGSDIRTNNGDFAIPASMQFGAPVNGETVSIGREYWQPSTVLGTVLNSEALNLTGWRVDADGVPKDIPYTGADLATTAATQIATAAGPSFTPAVDALLGVMQFTTTVDESGNNDRKLQIRDGATFAASIVIAEADVYAERLTNGRTVTVVFQQPVVLFAGKTYWLGVDAQQISHSGVTVKPLSVVESDDTWNGVPIRYAALDWPAPVSGEILVTLQGISGPNAIRRYFLEYAGLASDLPSYAVLTARYQSEGLVLGGVIQASDIDGALAEIDRHTRTVGVMIGDRHYLADQTVVSGAGLPRPRVPAAARISSPPAGDVKSELNYTYDSGSGSGSVDDFDRRDVIGVHVASLDLGLLAKGGDAAAAATQVLDDNGAQREITADHHNLAVIPGDLVEIDLFGTTLVWRVTGLNVSANPALLTLREV